MAKKKQHIDDFFKDQLSGKELPLDGSEWSRLANALGHEEKKRRGFFWWWFGAGSILIALLALGYYFYPNNKDLVNDHEQKTSLTDSSSDHMNSKGSPGQVKNNQALEENITPEPQVEPLHSENSSIDNSLNESDDEVVLPSSNNTTNAAPITAAEDDNSLDHHSSESAVASTDINAEPLTLETALLSLRSKGLNTIPWELVTLDSLENNKIKKDKESNRKVNIPKSKEVYLGINVMQTEGDMKFSSALLYNDYAAYRQLNEMSMKYLQIEFNAFTKYKKMDLGAGLQYGKLAQTSYLNQMNDPKTLTIQLYDSIPYVDINLDTTYLPYNFRDSVLTTSHDGKLLTVPTYHSISIPLSVGYELKLNKTFSLSTTASIQPTFILAANGSINSKRLNYQELNKKQLNSYYTAAALDLSLQTRITPERWLARIGYSANFTLGDLLKEDDISQRINSQGIHVSLYYRIN